MKQRFTKTLVLLSNNFLLVLIGLLGFSAACTKSPMEYGTPSADFILSGVILNPANQPIPNIKVVMSYDSTNTTSDGKFSLKNRTFPDNHTFNVRIRDIDGAVNGSYQDKDTTIVFDNNLYTKGDGHWYRGEVGRSTIIKLNSK